MLALRVTVSFTLVCEKEMKDNRKKKRDNWFFIINTVLALIVVEILLCRGSARKIETDSGNKLLEKSYSYIMYKLVHIYCMYFSNALYLHSQN